VKTEWIHHPRLPLTLTTITWEDAPRAQFDDVGRATTPEAADIRPKTRFEFWSGPINARCLLAEAQVEWFFNIEPSSEQIAAPAITQFHIVDGHNERHMLERLLLQRVDTFVEAALSMSCSGQTMYFLQTDPPVISTRTLKLTGFHLWPVTCHSWTAHSSFGNQVLTKKLYADDDGSSRSTDDGGDSLSDSSDAEPCPTVRGGRGRSYDWHA